MSLTIQLPLTVEENLRENAMRQGVSLENYIAQLLAINAKKNVKKNKKEWTENELLMHVQLNIHAQDLEEYHRLSNRFQLGNISEKEHEKLLQLNDMIELAHAERMKYVLLLSKMRHSSLEKTMDDLGIKRFVA
jgi:hypothetical protein